MGTPAVLPLACVEFVEFYQPLLQFDAIGLCSLSQSFIMADRAAIACGKVVAREHGRGAGMM